MAGRVTSVRVTMAGRVTGVRVTMSDYGWESDQGPEAGYAPHSHPREGWFSEVKEADGAPRQ